MNYNTKFICTGLIILIISEIFAMQADAKSSSFPQQQITGKVTDMQTDKPLPGVNITVKGTTAGTFTDSDGTYSLTVASLQDTLVFSFVGYETLEIPINGKTVINVSLKPQALSGEELVVVGYGEQKARDLTGSIKTVDSEELSKVSSTNAVQAIQGRVAGVNVSQNSWQPGAGATVRIRGRRSITASADPLYVIDGSPMARGSITINDIDPSNIASMEVLKDASATAIYGSRGANGVILITTKRGHAGETTVRYNSYAGIQKPLNPLRVYNGARYAKYIRDSFRNSSEHTYHSSDPDLNEDRQNPQFAQDPYVLESLQRAYDNGNYDPSKVRDFNWIGATRRTGIIQNHSLSVSGGTEKTQVMASLGYHGNKGIVKDQDFNRYNLRVNVDHKFYKDIKVSASTYLSRIDQSLGTNLVGGARDLNPLARPRDDNGNWILNPGNDPLTINTLMDIDGVTNKSQKNRVLANLKVEVPIVSGLQYRLNAGYDYRTARDGNFESSMSAARNRQSPAASYGGNKSTDILIENILVYQKSFKNQNLKVTALQSFHDRNFETFSTSVEGLPYESQLFYNVGSASTINGVGSSLEEWRLLSYMGRVNYSLFDKYLFTVTARSDGSSRLAPGNKYHLFPSAAFGWRISDEKFLQSINFINNLKLRLSYGKTGNSAINPYQTLGSLELHRYVWGEQVAIGYAPGEIPNSSLTWETTAEANIGLDFAFLENRISGTIGVYRQNTTNLLMPRRLPVTTGFESVLTNVGKTRNTGLEVSLSTVNVKSQGGKFRWNTGVVFSSNKEEIRSIVGGKVDDIGNEWFIGHPINVFYDLDAIGIWQDTPKDKAEMAKFNANGHNFELGTVRIKDQNGDYKINSEDRVILGNPEPKWTLGLSNQFNYKNFDLSFQIYASYGRLGYYDQNLQLNGRYNMVAVDYWTPEHPTNRYPKPNFDWLAPDYINTTYYEDASYARLKYVTLGYTFSQNILQGTGINNLRVYVSAQNPYLLTNFSGPDPEGGQGMQTASPKTFMGGLNIKF